MQNTPVISVIVPCYNQGKYLNAALTSVFAQSFKDWECIIVNDGSQDDTENVALQLCKIDERVKYHKKANGGLSSARNIGLKIASGKYVQFLDADDLIEPEKFLGTINLYQSQARLSKGIVYSSSRYFEDAEPETLKILGRNNFISHIELKIYDALQTQNELLTSRNVCVISASIYPIGVFYKVGDFDETLKAVEDWDFNLRCSNAGYYFHHESLECGSTLIRLHDSSMMRNTNHMQIGLSQFRLKHGICITPLVNHNGSIIGKVLTKAKSFKEKFIIKNKT